MKTWESDAVTLLSEFVGIDSVNPRLVADAAGEAGIAQALTTRCSGPGSRSPSFPPDPMTIG